MFFSHFQLNKINLEIEKTNEFLVKHTLTFLLSLYLNPTKIKIQELHKQTIHESKKNKNELKIRDFKGCGKAKKTCKMITTISEHMGEHKNMQSKTFIRNE